MPNPPLDRRRFLALTGLLGGVAASSAACSGSGSSASQTGQTSRPAGSPTTKPGPTGATQTPSGGSVPPPLPAGLGRNAQGDVVHGSRTGTALALTFHGAGDPALATRVLAELRAAGVHVTVFAVGSWLQANPSMASAILDAGHELGNHTYHHLAMRTLGAATAGTEVARCAAVLKQLTGSSGRWFRPSGTPESNATIRAAARSAGYSECISYDVDSLDWTDPGPTAVTHRVLADATAGSIVSLHLGHSGTATALPALVSGLQVKGLHPVTLSELVA